MRPERRAVPGLADELPALRESLARDNSPRNVMRVAEGYWLVGEPAEAIAILEPLLERDATMIAPRVLLAWCLEDAGRDDAARACRVAVSELDPANPYGTPGEAPPAAEPGAAEPGAEEPGAAEPAEDAYTPPDDELEAEPERALTAEELRRIPPGPLYSATLAEIFARQGFQEKAIEIYREISRAEPDRTDVRERIQVLEAERGGAAT